MFTSLLIQQKQSGSALIISLLILLVMTIVGVSTLNSTVMEQKMASNSHDMAITFQAAEAAIGSGIAEATPWMATIFDEALDECKGKTSQKPERNYTLGDMANGKATLAVAGVAHPPNSSMGKFRGYDVEITGEGQITATAAKAVNLQGATKGPFPKREWDVDDGFKCRLKGEASGSTTS